MPETACLSAAELPAEKRLELFPFPEFTESGLLDLMGRNVRESLDAVRRLTGLNLTFAHDDSPAHVLGRSFWQALICGGYKGAAYYIDSTKGTND
jgi:hypothetical protein